jgi:CDP-diglyceride synthetase
MRDLDGPPSRDVRAAWAFLPALGGALAHAPVLRYDLLRPLRRPLDAGTGLFGDNKTWRGALVMWTGTAVAAVALTRQRWFRRKLPRELGDNPLAYGALLGAGVVAGELPNSFFKRRLGIGPGQRAHSPAGVALALLDQGDFVLFSRLTLAPLWRMSASQMLEAFAVVAAAHSAVNVVGYAIGARQSPV